jgi:hypothetical protein
MGLPKNYQKQSTQINKRFESLNDLNYYKVTYDFRFTKAFLEQKIEENVWDDEMLDWGIPIETGTDNPKYGNVKKFSALDDESAEKKITEWLDKQVENKIFSEYEVISTEIQSLEEVLREKGLLPLINLKKQEL